MKWARIFFLVGGGLFLLISLTISGNGHWIRFSQLKAATFDRFGWSPTWSDTLGKVRREYPEVPQLSTASLSAWLAGPVPFPILLDVRTPEEFAVSHLLGDNRALTLAEANITLEGKNRDLPIVVYCSVGYRSSRLARELRQAGWKKVWNLEGSLFAWANEGRPLYRTISSSSKAEFSNASPTKVLVAHPFDDTWGKLLKANLHQSAP